MSRLHSTKSFPIVSSLTTTNASPADSFVDSMGIGVHVSYNDTAYADGTNLLNYLTNLGIRNIRDGVVLNRPDIYPTVQAIAAAGIKTNMIVGYIDNSGQTSDYTSDLQARLAALKDPAQYGDALIPTLEAPNEYDLESGLGFPDWANNLYSYIQTVYPLIKSDSKFGSVPYIGPSFGGYLDDERFPDNSSRPNPSQYMDAGNMHCYPGGRMPANNMPGAITEMAEVSASKPVYATESGYHNAVNAGNSANYGVTQQSQSIYMLRLFLEYFRQGIISTFEYELFDERPEAAKTDQEQHYGIVSVTGDPSADPSTWIQQPKQAYTSLQRLIALMSDPGNGSTPSSLAYDVNGAPASLHHMIFGRLDGSYDLVLWNAVAAHADDTFNPYDLMTRTAPYAVVGASQKGGISDANHPTGYTYPAGSVAHYGDQDVEYARLYEAVDGPDILPADIPVLLTLPAQMTAKAARPHYSGSFDNLGRGQRLILPLGVDPTIVRLQT